jgi:hypothetical protein
MSISKSLGLASGSSQDPLLLVSHTAWMSAFGKWSFTDNPMLRQFYLTRVSLKDGWEAVSSHTIFWKKAFFFSMFCQVNYYFFCNVFVLCNSLSLEKMCFSPYILGEFLFIWVLLRYKFFCEILLYLLWSEPTIPSSCSYCNYIVSSVSSLIFPIAALGHHHVYWTEMTLRADVGFS